MGRTRLVQVYIPPQQMTIAQNPHLSFLEKRLGVLLDDYRVTAAFNQSFFNGDCITHLNGRQIQGIDDDRLRDILSSSEKIKVTISTKHGVDSDEHSDVEESGGTAEDFHVFNADKKMVSIERCCDAKPKEYLLRGLYTLSTTCDKLLRDQSQINYTFAFDTTPEPTGNPELDGQQPNEPPPLLHQTCSKDSTKKNIILRTPNTLDSIPIKLTNGPLCQEFRCQISTYLVLNHKANDYIMPNAYMFIYNKICIIYSGGKDGIWRVTDMFQAYQRNVQGMENRPGNCVAVKSMDQGPYLGVYKNNHALLAYYDFDVPSAQKVILIKNQIQCLDALIRLAQTRLGMGLNLSMLQLGDVFGGGSFYSQTAKNAKQEKRPVFSNRRVYPLDFCVVKIVKGRESKATLHFQTAVDSISGALIQEMDVLRLWILDEYSNSSMVTDYFGENGRYCVGCWANVEKIGETSVMNKVVLVYELDQGPPLPDNWLQLARQAILLTSYTDIASAV